MIPEKSWPQAATAAVDWVELFEGDDPTSRRQLRSPADWNGRLKPELVAAIDRIQRARLSDVEITGSMRLPTGLLVGQQLSEVAGFKVAIAGREGEWSSTTSRNDFGLVRDVVHIGQGDDLAVALAISQPISDDVSSYIEAEGLPIGQLIVYSPEHGASPNAVPSPQDGLGAVDAVSAALRDDTRLHRWMLHVFLAVPLPLAVFVGHRWNRMPQTQLYEDLGPACGYAPSFSL